MIHLAPLSPNKRAQNLSGKKEICLSVCTFHFTHGASGVIGRPGRRAAARVTSSC